MLHIVFDDDTADDKLRPIPFPRERITRYTAGRDAGRSSEKDAGWMAERALEQVQSKIDELDGLLSGPLPFPGRDDDDGPWAA
ncbi:MAG TPA: hypothetical protein ENK11_01080 [Phycisphaerales bacterium]|nr:hypothetical protein [Phycisphaerales bacterium]